MSKSRPGSRDGSEKPLRGHNRHGLNASTTTWNVTKMPEHLQRTEPPLPIHACAELFRGSLDVQDDGIGFDQAEIEASDSFELSGGYGLIALRERVEQLGGTRIIESTPGQGTTLVVQIPLDGQHFDGQSQQDSTDISERPLQKVTHDVNTNTNHR